MKKLKFPMILTEGGISARIRKTSQVQKGKTYPLFIVDYHLLGKRKRECRAEYEEAKQVALTAIRKIGNGEQNTMNLTNADCLIYRRSVEELASLQVPLDAAARDYASAMAILEGRAGLAEVCRDWVKSHAKQLPRISITEAGRLLVEQARTDGKSNDRQKQLGAAIGRLAENFNVDVHTVTPGQISQYLAALPFVERTKRNHRDTIGFFNRWLVMRGYLAKGMDWLENVQTYSARKLSEIEIYTPQELSQLLGSGRDMTPFFAIAAFAGLRHAEIARLDWHEVDMEDGFIEVHAANSKTGERRLVPIQANLKKWLAKYHRPNGKVVSYANTTKQLLKIAKVAGVKWKHNALRHSFISYRVAETADVPRVSDEAGNSPAMIRQHYLRRVKPAAASEWFAIVPPEKPATAILDAPKPAPAAEIIASQQQEQQLVEV